MVARIATGELADNPKNGRNRSGKSGGAARTRSLSPAERHLIAKKAAAARWKH
jgi:hypothetical protein